MLHKNKRVRGERVRDKNPEGKKEGKEIPRMMVKGDLRWLMHSIPGEQLVQFGAGQKFEDISLGRENW